MQEQHGNSLFILIQNYLGTLFSFTDAKGFLSFSTLLCVDGVTLRVTFFRDAVT